MRIYLKVKAHDERNAMSLLRSTYPSKITVPTFAHDGYEWYIVPLYVTVEWLTGIYTFLQDNCMDPSIVVKD